MNSKFTSIVRVLLGILLLLSGINKFCRFLPNPIGDFIESFGQVNYILPVVGVFEIIIAAMLLIKKWVAFALILLVPISLNILLFHLYLNLSGIIPALVLVALNGILVYKYWRCYRPLFN
jgi:uncharacterized membrane protein YphA (DoxX/SURF4 family)